MDHGLVKTRLNAEAPRSVLAHNRIGALLHTTLSHTPLKHNAQCLEAHCMIKGSIHPTRKRLRIWQNRIVVYSSSTGTTLFTVTK